MMKTRLLAVLIFAGLLALPVLVALDHRGAAASAPQIVITVTAPPAAVETAEATDSIAATAEATVTDEAASTGTPEVRATADATKIAATDSDPLALVGDAARGDDLFHNGLNGAPPCATCHNPNVAGKGNNAFALAPGLKGISERAATRVDGMTAEEYLEDSILHPENYIVSGFRPIMPPNFSDYYTSQDIADLIAYLETL